jgi:hypothetical protein
VIEREKENTHVREECLDLCAEIMEEEKNLSNLKYVLDKKKIRTLFI